MATNKFLECMLRVRFRKIYNGGIKLTKREIIDDMSSSFSISLLGKMPLLSLCHLTLSTIPRTQLIAAYPLNR